MSYQDYPPPGYGSVYPPPQQPGYPPAPPSAPPQYMSYQYPDQSSPGAGYTYPPHPHQPPYQGYFAQNYPPHQPQPQPLPPYQVYHCEHDDQNDCSSFFKGCFAALCFCCVLEECFG